MEEAEKNKKALKVLSLKIHTLCYKTWKVGDVSCFLSRLCAHYDYKFVPKVQVYFWLNYK